MPITQDRVINLVAYADVLLQTFDGMKTLMRYDDHVTKAMVDANSSLMRDDVAEPTKNNIRALMFIIEQMTDYIRVRDIPQYIRDGVAEERIHFKKHRKGNEHMANYRRALATVEKERRGLGDITMDYSPATTPAELSAEDKALYAMLHSPEAIALNERNKKINQYREEAAERKRLRDLPSPEGARAGDAHHEQGADAGAEGHEEDIVKTLIEENKGTVGTEASVASVASEAANQPAPVSALTGPSYDPSVVATSVPSLEELNKTPFAPGVSLF